MTRKEKINQLNNIFAEINEDDNAVCYLTSEDNELIKSAIEALEQESQTFEWCTGCREYDQEKHCCHRWSKVIRDTVEEMKQTKVGHWIFDEILDRNYYCSECKSMGVDYWDYCPYCGARMVEPQESEES